MLKFKKETQFRDKGRLLQQIQLQVPSILFKALTLGTPCPPLASMATAKQTSVYVGETPHRRVTNEQSHSSSSPSC